MQRTDGPEALQSAEDIAAEAQDIIHAAGMSDDLAEAIGAAYDDSEKTSFARINETFTNICDRHELLARIVDCCASL